MKQLKIKKLHPDAIIPKYATAGAACFDLHALFDESINMVGNPRVVNVISSEVFHTGLAFEVPVGYMMLIYSRSGHGFKNNVRLANCVGVIDSDYRGEVCVKLTADNNGGVVVRSGDRIAQAMLLPVEQWALTEVADLSNTDRGDGGFGSTGA